MPPYLTCTLRYLPPHLNLPFRVDTLSVVLTALAFAADELQGTITVEILDSTVVGTTFLLHSTRIQRLKQAFIRFRTCWNHIRTTSDLLGWSCKLYHHHHHHQVILCKEHLFEHWKSACLPREHLLRYHSHWWPFTGI